MSNTAASYDAVSIDRQLCRTASRPFHDAAARRERTVAAMRGWIEANLPRFFPAPAGRPTAPTAAAAGLARTLFLIVHPGSAAHGTPVDIWARRMANRVFARLAEAAPHDEGGLPDAMSIANDPITPAAFIALAAATGRTYPGRDALMAHIDPAGPKQGPAAHVARALLGAPAQELDLWMRMDESIEQMAAGRGQNVCRTAAEDLCDATLCLTRFGTRRGQIPTATKSAIFAMAGRLASEYLRSGDCESAAHLLLSQAWAHEAPPDFDTMHELIARVSRIGCVPGLRIPNDGAPAECDFPWAPSLAVFRAVILSAPAAR